MGESCFASERVYLSRIQKQTFFFLTKHNSNANCSHFFFLSEQNKVHELLFSPLFWQIPEKSGEREISLALASAVLGSWDDMKSCLLALSLFRWHFFSFSKWSSSMYIFSLEQSLSWGVCLLSVDQTFFSKFSKFCKLWKFSFVFYFACLVPPPSHFEKSCVSSENP